MKNLLLFISLLLLSPASVLAQNFSGMQQMDMQKLQEMQACMERVDEKQLKAIEQQQQQFEAKIKPLCHSGKRDQAQKKAVEHVKVMMENPAIKTMRKCGEIAKGIMPDMPFMEMGNDFNDKHVCDAY